MSEELWRKLKSAVRMHLLMGTKNTGLALYDALEAMKNKSIPTEPSPQGNTWEICECGVNPIMYSSVNGVKTFSCPLCKVVCVITQGNLVDRAEVNKLIDAADEAVGHWSFENKGSEGLFIAGPLVIEELAKALAALRKSSVKGV